MVYTRTIVKQLLIISALIAVLNCYAQKEANIWYFGNYAGLDFNSGAPLAIDNSKMTTAEGCASIADANGSLLFYTDGRNVWNKAHELMPNGTTLAGNQSSSQSAVIVPKPGSKTIYYIFTATEQGNNGGIKYSEVNLSLDNGLGDITQKNIQLLNPACEKLAVVKNGNNTGFWVLAHGYNNSNTFAAYLVTATGVNTTPVTSNTGIIIGDGTLDSHGYLKFSPDGTKVASCNTANNVELFDFDTVTGILTNPKSILTIEGSYGAEFSASGSLLYVTVGITGATKLLQYDMAAADIGTSAVEIKNQSGISIGALQMAPDGRIYAATYGVKYVATINNPEVRGAGCNFVENSVALLGGSASTRYGLPQFIQSYFTADIIYDGGCANVPVHFSISKIEPTVVAWKFGDGGTSQLPAPSHTYTQPGTYNVTATVNVDSGQRTLKTQITIIAQPVANPIANQVLCGNDATAYSLSQNNTALLGSQSTTNYTVDYFLSRADADAHTNMLPNDYTFTMGTTTVFARLSNAASISCYDVAQFTVTTLPAPDTELKDKYGLCADSGSVTIQAAPGFDEYEWSNGERTSFATFTATGDYSLTITKIANGLRCETTTPFAVVISAPAVIVNIEIYDFTQNNNTIVIVATGPGDYEYSINGSTYQDSPKFTNLKARKYTVYVRDKLGCGVVTDGAFLLTYPNFFTPNADGSHDTWSIAFSQSEPGLVTEIYDRFGKLITTLIGSNSWDGTFNGRPLPATDYWFVVHRKNGSTHKGHFSLLR